MIAVEFLRSFEHFLQILTSPFSIFPCVCSKLVFLERIMPTYDNKVYDYPCLIISFLIFILVQRTLLSTNLPMYSPASKQPHLEQVKHHKCHCFSKANNDWPLRMSSSHPAHSKHKQECERSSVMNLIIFV